MTTPFKYSDVESLIKARLKWIEEGMIKRMKSNEMSFIMSNEVSNEALASFILTSNSQNEAHFVATYLLAARIAGEIKTP